MHDGDAPFETDVHKSKLRKCLACSLKLMICLRFEGLHWRPLGIRIHIWRSHADKNVAHGGESASWDDTTQCRQYAHTPFAIGSRRTRSDLEEYHPTGHHQFNIKLSSRECVIWSNHDSCCSMNFSISLIKEVHRRFNQNWSLKHFILSFFNEQLCVILEPMQELMSRHKAYSLSPRDCLKTTLFQKWQRMVAPPGKRGTMLLLKDLPYPYPS